MRNRRTNNTQLASDLLRGHWLLHNAEALLPLAKPFLNRDDVVRAELQEYRPMFYTPDGDYDDLDQAPESSAQKVIVIPMHGALTKYWSCSTVGTLDLALDLLDYANDDSVVGFVLDIDSPGGAGNAIAPMLQAIRQIQKLGKPIVAHCDFCASAALWIASQCDAVMMDNTFSEIGSLGAYASILDNRENLQTGERIITVYADESEDKNRAVREALEGKYDTLKAELSELVADFRAAVQAGRPNLQSEQEGVMTGAMFRTEKAIALGLADGMMTLKECIDNVFIRAEFK